MSLHYYPLINKLITTLNLRDRLAFLADGKSLESAFTKPFITIAREPGSGGAPIARAVAEKLGWRCIDEQIVEDIAKSTKKRKAIIRAIDERQRSLIDDMLHSLLNPEYVDDVRYVQELVRVILSYAHQGNVVILGRGANFMTPFPAGLHVNITAPYDLRVRHAMQFEHFKEAEAKRVIAETEKERKLFVKQYFRKDINKANSYDLTLNTSGFTINQARDIVIEAFYRKFSRTVRYGSLFKK